MRPLCAAAQWLSKWPNWTVTSVVELTHLNKSISYARGFEHTPEGLLELSDYIESKITTDSMFFCPATDSRDWLAIDKKMCKSDVSSCGALWADIDCYNVGISIDAATYLLMHKTPESLPGPPSIITCSGAGVHGYWLLKAPYSVLGANNKPDFAGLMTGFEDKLRGIVSAYGDLADKACTDITRMLRLPYTLNIPNAKKRLSGRGITRAREIQLDNGLRYELDDFPSVKGRASCDPAISNFLQRTVVDMLKGAPPVDVRDLEELPISNYYKKLIISDEQHNETAAKILTYLIKEGISLPEIYAVVYDVSYGIGRYFNTKGPDETRRQIARCFSYLQEDEKKTLEFLKGTPFDGLNL
jgi:hypothetical protein